MFGKKELSIAAAAALAACTPQKEKAPQQGVSTEQVTPKAENGNDAQLAYDQSVSSAEATLAESERVSAEFDKALAEKYNVSPEQQEEWRMNDVQMKLDLQRADTAKAEEQVRQAEAKLADLYGNNK